jgi:hypothetical protein
MKGKCNMNLKVKAGLLTLGALGGSVVAALATVEIIKMIGIDLLPWMGVGFLMVMAVYVFYNMILGQLQDQAKIQQMIEEK